MDLFFLRRAIKPAVGSLRNLQDDHKKFLSLVISFNTFLSLFLKTNSNDWYSLTRRLRTSSDKVVIITPFVCCQGSFRAPIERQPHPSTFVSLPSLLHCSVQVFCSIASVLLCLSFCPSSNWDRELCQTQRCPSLSFEDERTIESNDHRVRSAFLSSLPRSINSL